MFDIESAGQVEAVEVALSTTSLMTETGKRDVEASAACSGKVNFSSWSSGNVRLLTSTSATSSFQSSSSACASTLTAYEAARKSSAFSS